MSVAPPIADMTEPCNDQVVLRSVIETVHALAPGVKASPTITGAGSSVDVRLVMAR